MKEVIRLEKSEEAVSPVIATILMVAITVVLAATVYILVSHYTSAGAPTPLAATLAEQSESGGTATFSLSLSSPSSITNPSSIHISVSGPGISGTLSLAYTAGATDYWMAENGSGSDYFIVVTFTNTNGIPAGTSDNYVSSGATMNVYVVYAGGTTYTPTFTPSGAPQPGTNGAAPYISSGASMSGLSVSMTVSGYSGTVTASAP